MRWRTSSHVNAGEGLGARLLQRPGGQRIPGPQDGQQRARRQHRREARRAEAGLRPAQRPRHAHRRQLHAAHRRRLRRAAGLARNGRARATCPILAWFSYSKQWAVDYVTGKEGLLMAPGLRRARDARATRSLTLQDFDFYEIHEAFAAQVLCTLQGLGIAGVLQGAPGPRPAAGQHRSRQAQRERIAASPSAIRSRPRARASWRRWPSSCRSPPRPGAA